MKTERNNRRGFTLVEIMIVVAIIALLAAISIPNFIGYRNVAHAKACAENMKILHDACRTYQVNHGGDYTESQTVLVGNNGIGVLRSEVKCPVGGSYTIKYDTTTQDFLITCSSDNDSDHKVSENKE